MKTNTFIFNFINPSRLVYLATNIPAESPAEKRTGAVAEDVSGVDAAAAKVVEEKGRIAAEAAKKAVGIEDKREAEKKELEGKIAIFQAANDLNGLEKLAVEIPDLMKKAKKSGDNMALADFAGLLSKTLRAREQLMAKVGGKSEMAKELVPTKEMVADLLNGKKNEIKKLLEYFAREEYAKGLSGQWNFEVLSILGQKDAPKEDKKKWIEAFQGWVDTKIDGAIGPKTMLALATKVGESGLGRKIEGTMIARRDKKDIKGDTMVFTEEEAFAYEEKQLAAKEHYAKGKELYENEQRYAEALVEFEAANKLIPHPATLKAIAGCKFETGDYDGAARVYQRVLKNPGKIDIAYVEGRIKESKNLAQLQSADLKSSLAVELKKGGVEKAVASAETENRPAGTYYNPENPQEGGTYDEGKAPKSWKQLKDGEELPQVASLEFEEDENAQG